jgi:arsenate reductase (glutaredoxin)
MKASLNNNTATKPHLERGLGRPVIYGIPNCDTSKKALTWLSKNNIAFTFHDYKLQGISKEKLEEWCNKQGWETIFNKRSTTWRELPKAEQNKVINQSTAIKIMVKNTSIIKRPLVEYSVNLLVGFNEEEYKRAFK